MSDFSRCNRVIRRELKRIQCSNDDLPRRAERVCRLLETTHDPDLYTQLALLAAEMMLQTYQSRADEIERAINLLRTCIGFGFSTIGPTRLARVHRALADAYAAREEDQDDDRRRAIVHYETSLDLWPEDCDPRFRADVHHQIGTLYTELAQRDEAISHLLAALTLYPDDVPPVTWATIQSDLGLGFLIGDDADAPEHAIDHLQMALKFLTPDASAFLWAHAQFRLATAYLSRQRGEKAANLQAAIDYLRRAEQYFSKDRDAEMWAEVRLGLGTALCRLYKWRRTAELEEAIKLLEDAQEVFTRSRAPLSWARIERQLASACASLPDDGRGQNLRRSREHYQRAIDVFHEQGQARMAEMTRRLLSIEEAMAQERSRD